MAPVSFGRFATSSPAAVSSPHPQQRTGCAMGLAREFKEFAMKGNVIDMAVGVTILPNAAPMITATATPPMISWVRLLRGLDRRAAATD